MNLLIPYTSADLWIWGGLLLAEIPHQIWRFRTPFRVSAWTSYSDECLRIEIKRRFWFEWPKAAKKKYGITKSNDSWPVSTKVVHISPSDPDADERAIEAIVNAKADIKSWTNATPELEQLRKTAKRAIKR